jgi:hypothetical protein
VPRQGLFLTLPRKDFQKCLQIMVKAGPDVLQRKVFQQHYVKDLPVFLTVPKDSLALMILTIIHVNLQTPRLQRSLAYRHKIK